MRRGRRMTSFSSHAERALLSRLLLASIALLPVRLDAQHDAATATKTPALQAQRWSPIRRIFGQNGEVDDGYFRVSFPRTDLHVRIGSDELSAHFEFTGYFGFVPVGATNVMAMGEVILREEETPAALAEAHRQGVRVTALHNHLIGESPKIMYLHVVAEGAADVVASKLHAVLAKTATPLTKPAEEPSTADWSAIDAILGKHEDAEGPVAEYEFPRREHLTIGGHAVRSSGAIESGSEVVFQRLAAGRVATTGELYLLQKEVEQVVRALDEHGLHVTALHTHMLDDGPPHYWVHWYATGDGPTLARGIAAALSHTNSEQRSDSKK
jgi:hypothetical protein